MRVTTNMNFIPYRRNLENIDTVRFRDQQKISTGKDMNSIGDDPVRMGDVKKLTSIITHNEKYIDILDNTSNELLTVEAKLGDISDNVQKLRQLAIDSSTTGNSGNLFSLGVTVKGIMQDIVTSANGDYNGKYLFSGTKTNADSIIPVPPQKDSKPFEMVQSTPTASNPSGLVMVFKGNFKDRSINKDANSTEDINVKANQIFGANGSEMFDSLIGLYNLLTFRPDGQTRQTNDLMSTDDIGKLDGLQKKLADFAEKVDNATGRNGAIMDRMDSLGQMVKNENTRLGDALSKKEDTDIAKTSIDLKMAETAYQYTLQSGAKIIQNSLFDFLQ